MGLYEVPLAVSLLGFGIGTMLANFHARGIMFLLRAVLNILIQCYHTNHRTKYVGGHGMVTIINTQYHWRKRDSHT